MDFKIPDTPDTDSIWDRMGNEWQRKKSGCVLKRRVYDLGLDYLRILVR